MCIILEFVKILRKSYMSAFSIILFFFVKIKCQVHTSHPSCFFANVSNALGIHKGHSISGLVV